MNLIQSTSKERLVTLQQAHRALADALHAMQLSKEQEQYWLHHLIQAYKIKRALFYIEQHWQQWQAKMQQCIANTTMWQHKKNGGYHGSSNKQTYRNP